MSEMVFDIEANGKLKSASVVHCISISSDKGLVSFGPSDINDGLHLLSTATRLVGHNILCYDLPVLERIYGFIWSGQVFDTLNVSRLIYTNLLELDYSMKKIPKHLYGRHSLEAWGYRLGNYKGDYKGPWDKWSQEMQDYCDQDTRVTQELYDRLKSKNYSKEAIRIEHEFQKIIHTQETNGILFDSKKAEELSRTVEQDIDAYRRRLTPVLPSRIKPGKLFTPKRDNRTMGYKKGCDITKVTWAEPNPGSRTQVIDFFKRKYNWQPTVFTDNGNPRVDDEVLRSLPYPEAEDFADLYERIKIRGYLTSGKNAWLKLVEHGRIYGGVNTNGAVTGRCTHSNPNLSQVPSIKKYMGRECRELFHSGNGIMVGGDASGIELRMMGHYLYNYDGGEYAKEVVHGDVHEKNRAAGEIADRDTSKRFIYAMLYGAGNEKLGAIITGKKDPKENSRVGKETRDKLYSRITGLGRLVNDVKHMGRQRGYLIGLDGRHLHVRSDHKALNTLFQGAGAVVMKQANIMFWHTDWDCQQVLNVHDEWEVVTNRVEDYANDIGKDIVTSIIKSGEHFNLKLPLDGEYKIGKNWAEVH